VLSFGDVMLIKSLKILLAGVAFSALGACSTPCDAPGRLCAPIQANTSAPPAHARVDTLDTVDTVEPAAPEPGVQTQPVEAPPSSRATGGAAGVTRIGLLLPLRSEALGPPAEAVRAGFMAAYERDRDGFVVNLIETGDKAQDALDAYAAAAAANDIVVGPLARSSVGAVAASAQVAKPTIALNHPEARGDGAAIALPPRMLVMGLSIEDEARQVAAWANAEHPGASALIVSGTSAWQRRIANAFAGRWKQLGEPAQVIELPATNGYLSEAALSQLKLRVEGEPPALLFVALDADQVRQLRGTLGTSLPCYGTSAANPGIEPGTSVAELDGLRLLDLPWEVDPAHPAVMVYPRWSATTRTLDLDRLYALGIDAFRVAREIALHPDAAFKLDGVTGRLSVSFESGAARFERTQPTAVYQGGAFQLVTSER
jgi:outer membrane PBP1 activator LpoA protein